MYSIFESDHTFCPASYAYKALTQNPSALNAAHTVKALWKLSKAYAAWTE
jgi:hypothetical protein